MTTLQVINMCFSIFTYPFVIRVLGKEAFGEYAFSLAIVTCFITIVDYGFDLPCIKNIAKHKDEKQYVENLLGVVQTAKIYLTIASLILCGVVTYFIPSFRACWLLIAICFSQILYHILCPTWYFQGMQKMKYVTNIQLLFKVCTLPFIFLCLKQASDVVLYMVINSSAAVLSGITLWFFIRYREKLNIPWCGIHQVKSAVQEGTPFFLTYVTSMLKDQGVVILIGRYLGMADVAIYDLANKIITIPRACVSQINNALYPHIITTGTESTIRKIIRWEYGLGIGLMVLIALIGKWAVLLLGGSNMMDAWGISIILSVTILSWMVVGAIIDFRIIPSGKTYWITVNQAIACAVCFLMAGVGLTIWPNVYTLAIAIATAGIGEIIVCSFITKRLPPHD